MTLQKLSAGSGYEYLTRQVAALDSTEKGSIPLADKLLGEGGGTRSMDRFWPRRHRCSGGRGTS